MQCCQLAGTSRMTQASMVILLAATLATNLLLWPAGRPLSMPFRRLPNEALEQAGGGRARRELATDFPVQVCTGPPFGIVAADAIDFGGQRMEVRVREEKYDRDIVLTSRSTESSAQACERAGLDFLSALESSAGTCRRVRVHTAKLCRVGRSARLSIGWAWRRSARQSAWKSKAPSPTTHPGSSAASALVTAIAWQAS